VRRLPCVLCLVVTALAGSAADSRGNTAIDWPSFLARNDLVWSSMPGSWEEGGMLGNGLLGAMVYAAGDDRVVWELGRADVIDRRTEPADPMLSRPRLPIGRLQLSTVGAITTSSARLSLWNAEMTAQITTTAGSLAIRTFVHADRPVLLVELRTEGQERAATLAFVPDLAVNTRRIARRMPLSAADLNPAPFTEVSGDLRVSVQPRTAGGEYAVAVRDVAIDPDRRHVFVSIADSFPGDSARGEAVREVRRAAADGLAQLVITHQNFWREYYPASFVSLPDARLESFYWIQMYKLASATRARGLVIDNQGPWFRPTPWPGLWWNLNVQLSYWPVYTANRLALGESLLNFIGRNQAALRDNVPAAHRGDAMAISRASSLDGVSPVEEVPPAGPQQGALELSNLTWVLHNVWLHWRHSLDEHLLRDRLFPWLRASVNAQRAWLEERDGQLHFPLAHSPEYPTPARDTNYDLSLLRWGCATLLELETRLGLRDPMAPVWRDILARLVPYPVGPDGYQVGAGVPFAVSHRHFSHLLMVYPLRMVSGRDAAERQLIERSLAHWIGFEGALQGYSFVGASAISSLLGKGEDAVGFLDALIERYVKPNTMYLESGPVMETPLAAAQAIHELLLQSWGGTIRVFPALPATWRDVAFSTLRAEGAFLVSAVRRDGRTTRVTVTSLAGEPARLRMAMDRPRVSAARAGSVRRAGEGEWILALRPDESVTFTAGDVPEGATTIGPVTAQSGPANAFGRR
jgi:alpha-L-fucosidase 2